MKKIEAIVRPEKFEEIKTALEGAGCADIMVTDLHNHGLQKGMVQFWRGREVRVGQPMVKLEVAVADYVAPKLVQMIQVKASVTGMDSGKIFVTQVDEDFLIGAVEYKAAV